MQAAGRGSLLHLRLVAAACQVSKKAPSVGSLPQTLPEAYQYYLQALPAPPRGWPAAVEVLEVLVAAREPPSLAMLRQCGLQHAAEVVRALGLLLRITDVGQVYALHGTTLDFFTDREAAGALYADPARGHQRLCKALLVELDRGAGDASLYCLGNLVKHAHLGGDEAAVDRVVGDIDFLQRCFEVGVGEAVFRDIVQMRGRESGVVYDAVMFLRHNLADLVREPQRAVELAGSTPSGSHFARALKNQRRQQASRNLSDTAQYPSPLEDKVLGHPDTGTALLAFHPSSEAVFLGRRDGIDLMYVDHGLLRYSSFDHSSEILSIAVSSDGGILASGLQDGSINLWNLTTAEQISMLSGGHSGEVTSLLFQPCGKALLSVSKDGSVCLWNISVITPVTDDTSVKASWDPERHISQLWGISDVCSLDEVERIFHLGMTKVDFFESRCKCQVSLAWFEAWQAADDQQKRRVLWITANSATDKATAAAAAIAGVLVGTEHGNGETDDCSPSSQAVLSLFLNQNDLRSHDPLMAVRAMAAQLWKAFPQKLASYAYETSVAEDNVRDDLAEGSKVKLSQDYNLYSDAGDGPLKPGEVGTHTFHPWVVLDVNVDKLDEG